MVQIVSACQQNRATQKHTHTVKRLPTAICSPNTTKKKKLQKVYQSNGNRADSSWILLLHLLSGAAAEIHLLLFTQPSDLVWARVRSVSDPSSSNPVSKDKPQPRASPPAHIYVQHKTKNIHFDGPQMKALVLTEGHAFGGKVQKYIYEAQNEIIKEKKKREWF